MRVKRLHVLNLKIQTVKMQQYVNKKPFLQVYIALKKSYSKQYFFATSGKVQYKVN